MEILASLLTALFFWIFVYYCLTDSLRRARQTAGRPLLVVKHPRWLGYLNRVSASFLAVVVLGMLIFMPRNLSHVPGSGLAMAMMIFNVFLLMFTSALVTRQLSIGFELREHGIVRHCGWRTVLLWQDIKYCQWTAKPGMLRIQRHRAWFPGKYPIDPEQMREVTAILVKYVEVRDATGTIPEDELRRPELSDEPTEVASARFQFSLTAMFLLLLVASAAFSWFGIRYRRDQRQAQALERLDEFSPEVSRLFSLQLDFSQCERKPTDADLADLTHLYELGTLDLSDCPVTDETLAHLENLTRLRSLRLQGTRITDAGLKHLHKLPGLRYIDLSNTAATNAGVAELRQAFPDATILFE